ncbi:MAG: ADP-ribosylglycohydrolase family protein [Clostridia bacterium]|nr:ADP-ribosylglycohydrolase family protein [Clostridia bacterium]
MKEQVKTRDYRVISKADYVDKTTAGFVAQVVGMLTGYEFVTLPGTDRGMIGMPDDWFAICAGPYAGPNPHKVHTNKLIKNESTGIWETWIDDDFSVDIFNQYILQDMYREKGTICQKYVSDGWTKYDIYDMGGGNRYAGACGYIKKYGYLPQFAGNTEFGNKYSYCTEPYLGADTLGMNAAGMPETAARISGIFASVTGERDNVGWARLFAVMMSRAYFESDIPALIRSSADVFPEGAWQRSVIDEVFELYRRYPDDWRAAYHALEDKYYVAGDTRMTNNTVNCAFVLLDLLYGGGDYMETCKIGALAGYDCESTCGIALTVVAIIKGMSVLPDKVNELVWQDGKGVITNLPPEGLKEMYWMNALALPHRLTITHIVDMYRENFESILKENGGYWDEENYYVPHDPLKHYDAPVIMNNGFEAGDLSHWSVKCGKAEITPLATAGLCGARLAANTELAQRITGLTVGRKYTLSAFIMTTQGTDAFLFARGDAGQGSCASVSSTEGFTQYVAHKPVLRTLTFTAWDTEAEIGIITRGDEEGYAITDDICIVAVEESPAGTASLTCYEGGFAVDIVSETDKEAYLKLSFTNASNAIINIMLACDGGRYCGAALYKTANAEGLASGDSVYLPVTVGVGCHRIEVAMNRADVCITAAEFLQVNNRF